MLSHLRFAALLPLTVLLGCTVSPTTSTTAPAGNWTNWQIQAGAAITSPPNTYPSFVGAIQIQATQVSGVFTPITQTGSGTAQDYTGSFDSSTQDLSLITFGYAFGFTEPSIYSSPIQVNVTGGCVAPSPPIGPGAVCNAIFVVPSIGVEIAPLSGTYTGTLTAINQPSLSGTATLTLTQSPTPNSSGAFPLTGTMTFPASGDPGASPVAGTVSGEGVSLTPVNAPGFYVGASTNPTTSQVVVTSLAYGGGGIDPDATFAGTLTRQ
jgi:hypothetical protein